MTDPWQTLLLADMARGRYLRLGRPVNEYDWWSLLAMAQGWTVIAA